MKLTKPFKEPVVLLEAPFQPNVALMRAAVEAGAAPLALALQEGLTAAEDVRFVARQAWRLTTEQARALDAAEADRDRLRARCERLEGALREIAGVQEMVTYPSGENAELAVEIANAALLDGGDNGT